MPILGLFNGRSYLRWVWVLGGLQNGTAQKPVVIVMPKNYGRNAEEISTFKGPIPSILVVIFTSKTKIL